MWRSLLRLPPVAFVWGVVDTYNRLGVARAAAALAYFLILTLFPLLMCVNFFIGLLPLSPEDVFSALDSILPRESLSLILDYLDYVSAIPQSQSTPLLLACLFTIGLSASAGLRTLLQTMDELYQVRRINSLHRLVLSVSLSLLFLLTIYLSSSPGSGSSACWSPGCPRPCWIWSLWSHCPSCGAGCAICCCSCWCWSWCWPSTGWAPPSPSAGAPAPCTSPPCSPPQPWWPARCCSPGSSGCRPGTPWSTAPWPP